MSNLLCKLFRFFLSMFEQVVTVVASALKTIGTAAVDVLDDLLTSASGALGLPKLALLAGAGLLLWFFMSGDDEDESSPQPRPRKSEDVRDVEKSSPQPRPRESKHVRNINKPRLA